MRIPPSSPGRGPVPDGPHDWSPRWMRWVVAGFLTLVAALLATYLISSRIDVRTVCFVVARVVAAAVFALGVAHCRRGFRREWLMMLAAMLVWLTADVLAALLLGPDGLPQSWVLSGVLSLAAFVLMTVGVFRLGRGDGFAKGSSVVVDGLIYLLGTALVWWALVGQELLGHPGRLTPAVMVATVIPLGDGILLAGSSALLSSRAAHSLSSRALVGSCLFGLAGDLGFARYVLGLSTVVSGEPLRWIPATWMAQFACAGLAALASGRSPGDRRGRVSTIGILLVSTSLVVPPLVWAYASLDEHDDVHLHANAWPVLLAGSILGTVLVTIRSRALLRRLESQASELELTARTDELTQLPNRRAGGRLLNDAIAQSHEHGTPLHVAILDLDHFKTFNDTYGHQQGDRLLRSSSMAWATELAGRGTIFRYGGEEFVVLVPGLDTPAAEALLARLRGATPRGQTFSAGLVSLRPGETPSDLVGRADRSLYAAKAAGRARTMVCA